MPTGYWLAAIEARTTEQVYSVLLDFAGGRSARYRVLIHKKVVPPSKLEVPDGRIVSPMISCSYWTARSVKVASHACGMGAGAIDECPFVRTG